MIRVSGSALPRVESCPPSAVLPQVGSESEKADSGSALHDHMRDRAELGVDDAVAKLDERLAKWGLSEREAGFLRARLMKFEWSPPAGALCEVRLALWPDWTVTRVPAEQRFVPGALFTGQFDVVWSEPAPLVVNEDGSIHCPAGSVLWVVDLKGGQDRYVTTIERNLQIAAYTFLAARWTGAKHAVPAALYPGPGQGTWDAPATAWGPREIDAVERRLRELFIKLEIEERSLAEGLPLDLVEGNHCLYCPALTRCPAKTAFFKAIVDEGELPHGPLPLSATDRRTLANALPMMERITKQLRHLLEADVGESGPIDLGDGIVWGPETTERTEILAVPARAVLERELGEYAAEAMTLEISGTSIERAIKKKHEAEGIARQGAPAKRRLWAKLGEAGALGQKQRTEWKAHRPKLPAASLGDVEDLDPTG